MDKLPPGHGLGCYLAGGGTEVAGLDCIEDEEGEELVGFEVVECSVV